jgi:hypothetical protein
MELTFSWFFVIFLIILLYSILRKAYYYLWRLFLQQVFGAKVSLTAGYSFASIRDVHIIGSDFEIRFRLCKPAFGVHTHFTFLDFEAHGLTLARARQILADLTRLSRNLSRSIRYFHVSFHASVVTLEGDGRTSTIRQFRCSFSPNTHSLSFDSLCVESQAFGLSVRNYGHVFDHGRDLARALEFGQPDLKVVLNGRQLIVNLDHIIGYSPDSRLHRLAVAPIALEFTFRQQPFEIQGEYAFNVSDLVTFEFVPELKIRCLATECRSRTNDFELRMSEAEFASSQVHCRKCSLVMHAGYVTYGSMLRSFPWLTTFDSVDMDIQVGGDYRIAVALSDFRRHEDVVESDSFAVQLFAGPSLLLLATARKNHITLSSLTFVMKTLTISLSNSERLKRFWLTLFNLKLFAGAPGRRVALQIEDLGLVEELSQHSIAAQSVSVKCKPKPVVPLDAARPMLASVFPHAAEFTHVHSVFALSYSVRLQRADSAVALEDARLTGALAFLLGDLAVSLFGTLDTKARRLACAVDGLAIAERWLLTFNLLAGELRVRETTYRVANAKAGGGECSFESFEIEGALPSTHSDTEALVELLCPQAAHQPAPPGMRVLSSPNFQGLPQLNRFRRVQTHLELPSQAPVAAFPDAAPVRLVGAGGLLVWGTSLRAQRIVIRNLKLSKVLIALDGAKAERVEAEVFRTETIRATNATYVVQERLFEAQTIAIVGPPDIAGITQGCAAMRAERASFGVADFTKVEMATRGSERVFTSPDVTIRHPEMAGQIHDFSLVAGDRWEIQIPSFDGRIDTNFDFFAFDRFLDPATALFFGLKSANLDFCRAGRASTHHATLTDLTAKLYQSGGRRTVNATVRGLEFWDQEKPILTIPADQLFRAAVTFDHQSVDFIRLDLSRLLVQADVAQLRRFLDTFSPLFTRSPRLDRFPVCTFAEAAISAFELELSYVNPDSLEFAQEHRSRLAVPATAVKNRSLPLPGLMVVIAEELERTVRRLHAEELAELGDADEESEISGKPGLRKKIWEKVRQLGSG